jgi:hypothetical protein
VSTKIHDKNNTNVHSIGQGVIEIVLGGNYFKDLYFDFDPRIRIYTFSYPIQGVP